MIASQHKKNTLLGVYFLTILVFLVTVGCSTPTVPSVPAAVETPTPEETLVPTPEAAQPYTIAGFNEFLSQALSVKAVQRQALVDQYMAHLPDMPLTSDGSALFAWRGDASHIQLAGDMNNWQLESAPLFEKLPATDLWYLEIPVEGDARLDYKIVQDGVVWHIDPLNPRTMPGGFGPNSELVMPGYTTPDELLPAQGTIPEGSITSHTLDSTNLQQTRTFVVYKPASQIVGAKWPSVYFNDGGDYLSIIDATAILDGLIAERKIPPLVAVFIPPVNRSDEYSNNEEYAAFLAEELVPYIQANYNTDPDPDRTGVVGASLGGLEALHTALTHPDVFGLAAGQSGAYSVENDQLVDMVRAANRAHQSGRRPQEELRLFLVVGTYETAVSGDPNRGNLLAANRRLLHALESSQYSFTYEERPEGHSWGLWRGTLGQALSYLFNRAND